MSKDSEQTLLDDLYAAMDKSAAAGVSIQAAWGHVHTLGLHLEFKILQGVKLTETERHPAAIDSQPKEKP